MGFWRTLYYFIGVEYIGTKEQKQIDRQKHLKFVMCEQIKNSKLKLKRVNIIDIGRLQYEMNRLNKNSKKTKKK
jgi:hypothetical protein